MDKTLAVSDDQTANAITITNQVFVNNNIVLEITHPSVAGRTVTAITLSGKAECNYPQTTGNWVKTVDSSGTPCVDVYTLTIPWTDAYDGSGSADQDVTGCGLVRSSDATSVTFDGVAVVSYIETLTTPVDGIAVEPRQVSDVVRFQLTMPTYFDNIQTSLSSVVVFDAVSVVSVVSNQIFDPTTDTVTLTLLVSTAAPFRTEFESTTANPTNTDVGAPTQDDTNCADDGSAACQQKYTFAVTRTNGLCDVDGAYDFLLSFACQTNVMGPDCPTMLPDDTTVTVTLDSADLCAIVADTIAVTTTLTSHGSYDVLTDPAAFTFGAEQVNFVQPDTIFYQLVVNSDDMYPIDNVTIDTVDVVTLSSGTVDVASAPNWAFEQHLETGVANERTVAFAFTPAIAVFGDVQRNTPHTSTVTVAIDVVFANTAAKKRYVVRAAGTDSTAAAAASSGLHKSVTANATFGLQAAPATTTTTTVAATATPATVALSDDADGAASPTDADAHTRAASKRSSGARLSTPTAAAVVALAACARFF